MQELSIRKLRRDECETAAHVLGRGMRDNPNNVQAFGPDAAQRECVLAKMFLPLLRRTHTKGTVFGAFNSGGMLGVCAMTAPGQCRFNAREKLRILSSIVLGTSFIRPLRILRWADEWSRQDPSEPHWHLGPLAIDSQLQGRGIGRAMMADVCKYLDDCSAPSYLETDKFENVRFYQKLGFSVFAEAQILGVPNWFMSRRV